MAFLLIKGVKLSKAITSSATLLQQCSKFSSPRAGSVLGNNNKEFVASCGERLHLSPLFSNSNAARVTDCKIEIMDDETWQVSSGLANTWRGNENRKVLNPKRYSDEDSAADDNAVINFGRLNNEDPDIDEIEDMRIRGNLFYKLDKDSKEYEEYKFDFHRRKMNKTETKRNESRNMNKEERGPNSADKTQTKEEIRKNKEVKAGRLMGFDKNEHSISWLHELGESCIAKKTRTLTFNQLTAPYHEPFCLDIYISRASVRASIIHRATSKVVVVAHSISKDMKFDLGSTKNRGACAAVGEVLAQRALDDDIHNVLYTPRKGEKLEGKLQIVLKSIIDNGVDVKVKLKQRKTRKTADPSPRTSE